VGRSAELELGHPVRRSEAATPRAADRGEPRQVARLLRSVLTSPTFQRELREVSEYAAHVKQEREIIGLLAKRLHRDGHDIILEYRYPGSMPRAKCDLRLDQICIEMNSSSTTTRTSGGGRRNSRNGGDVTRVPLVRAETRPGQFCLHCVGTSGGSARISSCGSFASAI
jgi:hypothetical protein